MRRNFLVSKKSSQLHIIPVGTHFAVSSSFVSYFVRLLVQVRMWVANTKGVSLLDHEFSFQNFDAVPIAIPDEAKQKLAYESWQAVPKPPSHHGRSRASSGCTHQDREGFRDRMELGDEPSDSPMPGMACKQTAESIQWLNPLVS